MSRMLSKAKWGHNLCGRRARCCRSFEFVTHGGRQVGKVRKVQRSREKYAWKKEEL